MLPELPRGVLSTLNNKTGINMQDPTGAISTRLCQPIRPSNTPPSIVSVISRNAGCRCSRPFAPDHEVTDEVSVWPTGTRIDVLDAGADQSLVIYEMKVKKGEPIHLYQLLMYWDGLVHTGRQPTQAILIVPQYTEDLAQTAKMINETHTPPKLPDGSDGLPYNLQIAKFSEKELAS